MWNKIKNWLIGIGVTVVGVLCMLVHIKSKKIESLKQELKKETADNNVNKTSIEILENQIDKLNKLDESAGTHNELISEWNKK